MQEVHASATREAVNALWQPCADLSTTLKGYFVAKNGPYAPIAHLLAHLARCERTAARFLKAPAAPCRPLGALPPRDSIQPGRRCSRAAGRPVATTRLTICIAALHAEGRSVGCPDSALHAPGRQGGSVGRAARPRFFFAALRAACRSIGWTESGTPKIEKLGRSVGDAKST